MIGGGRRRLRRSAFCRADPAGQPSPASRLRRLWGQRGCKVGYLIGGILSPSRKNGLMIGDGRRRLRRSAFCRADPAGQSSPALRLRHLLGGAGLQGRLSYRGDFISLPQEWHYDRGGRRRLRRSAFCRADPAGQPSPALRLRRLFWGQRGYFSAAKRGRISGAPGPAR